MKNLHIPIKWTDPNTDNLRFLWESEGTEAFINWQWECTMYHHTATLEDSLVVLTNLIMLLPYDLLGSCPKELKTYFHTKMHMSVYGGFVYNCQNLEATMISFSRWVDK